MRIIHCNISICAMNQSDFNIHLNAESQHENRQNILMIIYRTFRYLNLLSQSTQQRLIFRTQTQINKKCIYTFEQTQIKNISKLR